ncbi:MAG: ATP-dependent DNA ligase [Meiothermus sp.]
MKDFARLYAALDSTTSTNEKIARLEAYFRAADPKDAVWALYILLEKARKSVVTSNVLRKHFLSLGLVPEWLFEESRAHVGDTAETVALLLVSLGFGKGEAWELPLHVWMETEIPKARVKAKGTSKEFTEERQRELLLTWWRHLPEDEVYILHKILTGAFRVGVSSGLVLKALAAALDADLPSLTHRLTGDWEPTEAFYRSLTDQGGPALNPSQPYPFMLAYPLEPEFQPGPQWQLEHKWDGIRAQVIRRAGETFIWSRGEDLVTGQFPELVEAFEGVPDGTVIDGEIVAWGEGRPLLFSVLQTRLGRKKVTEKERREAPVHLMAYDLLEQDGLDLRAESLEARRGRLEAFLEIHPIDRVHLTELLSARDREELERLRVEARERGAEGLMVKRKDSPYLEGRKKGYWWKHKVDPYALDAVLMYAQAGSGRRSNLFTDYTFGLWDGDRLVPFAKAYSGLTDGEIAELDRWIRQNTLDKFGPARTVRPVQVFEIAFEGIAPSARHKSGIAVRFPRILRWRKDKRPFEADTLGAAFALLPQEMSGASEELVADAFGDS